jgi:hypothetical protein
VHPLRDFSLAIYFIVIPSAHHLLYKESNILHGNLSESNLMIYRNDEGRAYGVLNDWDVATAPEADGGDTSKAQIGCRALSFVSVEMLSPTTLQHHYRHDLESFFWILLWCACQYTLNGTTGRKRMTPARAMSEWSSQYSYGITRRGFIHSSKEEQAFWLCRHISDAFKPLSESWIRPLWDLLEQGYSSLRENSTTPGYDVETLGGNLTFEKFMSVLAPKALNDV